MGRLTNKELALVMNIPPWGIQEQIGAKLFESYEILKEKIPHKADVIPDPSHIKIKFDLKGHTGGQANYTNWSIRLNNELLWSNDPAIVDEMINQTLPHEYAHLVNFKIYHKRGHGNSWVYIMNMLGLRADRTHDMPVQRQRAIRIYIWECAHKEWRVKRGNHAKLLAGNHYCKICHAKLTFVREEMVK